MTKAMEGRKPYSRPQIVYQAQIEAQAGSPISEPFDILNLGGAGK